MAARDDSVIRGSLIASLIFLVLSLALNFFLWRWGDTQASSAATANESLNSARNQISTLQDQSSLMKAMLGVGGLSTAEFDRLAQSTSGDPDMETIEREFVRNMAYLGEDMDDAEKNYTRLPEFFANAVRSRNEQYGFARDEATTIREQADSDVDNARKAQQVAEQGRDDALKKLETEQANYAEDREKNKKLAEDARDNQLKIEQRFNTFRQQTSRELTQLKDKQSELVDTVDNQRKELNRLRNTQFESVQGEVTYTYRQGNVVTINLGSADALRPGVTFGVVDRDDTRLSDAKIKASIQVTKILNDHLAEARVIRRPAIRNPIIPGDKIYSPFWAPGRKVKIALVDNIDIDRDSRPDTGQIAAQVRATGADVAAVVRLDGTVEGVLDSSVRFLVYGESVSGDTDGTDDQAATVGRIREQAEQLGITVIPSWKLDSFLRTIDDTVTTPLGSAVRGDDFEVLPSNASSRLPNRLPDSFLDDESGRQVDNEIARP
ncbi:MAG: hypothetical protein AAGD07_08320 [Planctomycetota bacterium]